MVASRQLRIVFMGTPDFAVPSLNALAERGEVVGVVTQPDRPSGRGSSLQVSPVKRMTLEYGLPIIQPAKLRDETVTEQLRIWRPTVIVVVAFGQLLPKAVLDLAPFGCVNVHASLLPRWRGAAPIPAAILAGDAETGISIMQMDRGLDTGPVFSQFRYPISDNTTATELYAKLSELAAKELVKTLPLIISGDIQPVHQEDELATYAPQLRKSDGEIDWRKSADVIERQLRAFDPWPGSFTVWHGQRLIIHEGTVVSGSRPPGHVLMQHGQLAIGCGEGLLLPERLQLAGKRVLETADFVRGQPSLVGAQLMG